jgi:transcription elongation GreA/GreB family factor
MLAIQEQLFQLCLTDIDERVAVLRASIAEARDAQQNDTKSSAGDKFETTREMMTQQIETLSLQLSEVEAQRHQLLSISNVAPAAQIQAGSVVYTDAANFYISVSVGTKRLNNDVFICLSASSPLGKLLVGKTAGDEISFNKKQYIVKAIS